MVFEHLLADLKALFFPAREAADALPVMDGPWTPNRALDEAPELGAPLPGSDDLASAGDGAVFISAGHTVWRCAGPQFAQREAYAELPAAVGALLAVGPALYAAQDDVGVVRLDESGRETAKLTTVDGKPLRCVTALAALADGRIVIADGSAHHPAAEWVHDLMEKRASGRLIIASADLSQARVIAGDLAWPAGLLVDARGQITFSEAWRHRLCRLSPDGKPEVLTRNLPGYPGRLADDGHGGAWLTVFAARTHLVELVLREEKFRREMLATIDPRYWIAPSLQSSGHYLEPLQGGALKKLGVIKPWAPPRSYGLVAQLTADGECSASWHSRAGGVHHGISAAREIDGHLLALSKGYGRVLKLEPRA